MRIPIRTSRWAIWARRLASLALPFEIIPVLMHRERMVASDTFTLLFGIGLALAFLAILAGLIALVRLWQTGFRGWDKALQALILGLIMVSPVAIAAYWATSYPDTSDVATTGELPRLVIDGGDAEVPLAQEARAVAFPTAVARTYTLPPSKVFSLVVGLVAAQNWEIRFRREPVAPDTAGRLNALAMTWFGYRDEVAIRIGRADAGSVVSMRSASLFGLDDLGANGRRIEAFLAALDHAVIEAERQGPIGDAPAPDGAGAETTENDGGAASAN